MTKTKIKRNSVIRWKEPLKSYERATRTKRPMPYKRVYICSPYSGLKLKENIMSATIPRVNARYGCV